MVKHYMIVGQYSNWNNTEVNECLIQLVCGGEEEAQKALEEVLANPPAKCLGGIRIKYETDERNCWWLGNLD